MPGGKHFFREVAIVYHIKNLKNLDTPKKNCCYYPRIRTMWLYDRVICPKGTEGKVASVDPDQNAPSGAF